MIFRPFYRFDTGCAAYVFGCGGQGICCVVDPVLGLPREAFVDEVGGSAPPKPEGMDEILRFNQGRT